MDINELTQPYNTELKWQVSMNL